MKEFISVYSYLVAIKLIIMALLSHGENTDAIFKSGKLTKYFHCPLSDLQKQNCLCEFSKLPGGFERRHACLFHSPAELYL